MLIIYNAKIYTFDPGQRVASAIAVDQGKIVAVGADDEIVGSFTRFKRMDANGQTILPGLTDSHIHLEDYALNLQKIDCEVSSRQECLLRVSERAKRTPAGEWILGHGWNQNSWPEGYGSASLLDGASPQNPVYLTHKSLHCGWANSTALKLAGITPSSVDPPGGRIGHLPNGEPDGILFESAMELLERVIPAPSTGKLVNAIKDAIQLLWQMGLTGVHDFDGPRCFTALQELRQQDELWFRVIKSIHLDDLPHAIEIGLRSGFGDEMLRIGWLKLFTDGALGPHTAAMLSPYEDDPHNSGILTMDGEQIFAIGRQAYEHGISLAVHAIGDRSNREVLDGYAKLREYTNTHPVDFTSPLRNRIEHVQVIHPADLPRFGMLDIIASMQPIHATSDMHMADQFWGNRSEYAYAWRSLTANQARLVFGSDAPVETPNPFKGLHAAVTRRRPDGSPSPAGWYPKERLSVEQAITAYTITPAFVSGLQAHQGSLKPGSLADFIIVNVNPFTCPPEDLQAIHPVATMVGGKWVYSEIS
jgi:predicted amidohydrolase YtcJ